MRCVPCIRFVLTVVIAFAALPSLLGPPALAGDGEADIEVLDAGSGEKTTLRYRFEEGREDRCEMGMKMSMKTSMNGMGGQSMDFPTMVTPFTVRTESVGEDGAAVLSFEYGAVSMKDDGGLPPAAKNSMKSQLGALEGARGTMRMTDRGHTSEFSIELGKDAGQMLEQTMGSIEQSMSQMTFPFPDEPLGVGARWRVSRPIETNGITMEPTYTLTLESIRDGGATVSFKSEIKADEQAIDLPANMGNPGMEVRLLSMDGSGEGSMEIDFQRGMAASMRSDGSFTQEIRTSTPNGQTMNMSQEISMKLTLSPAPDDASKQEKENQKEDASTPSRP